MVLSISSISEPVGSVKTWIRATAAVPLPAGWLICDGSVVSDASSTFNGLTLPDFRGRFPRGHSTLDNATFGANLNYFVGGAGVESGGVDSNNVNHAHNIGNASHQHNFNFFDPGHTHTISSDGNHTHPQTGGFGGAFDSLSGAAGTHNHSGATGSGNGGQVFGTTDFGGTNGSTDGNLGTIDNKPLFRGLIYIIKVK